MIIRQGKKVYIKQPTFEELDYVTKLWADYDTMKDIGGPVVFEESEQKRWYEAMVHPGNGRHFYCLICDLSGQPVGEVSFHRFDKETGSAEFNVKVKHEHRGKGYGKEAVLLLLDYYFNDFGGTVMTDPMAIHNVEGQKVMLGLGFEHAFSEGDVFMVKITKEKYNSII